MTLADELAVLFCGPLAEHEAAIIRRSVEALRAAERCREWLVEAEAFQRRASRNGREDWQYIHKVQADAYKSALAQLDQRPSAATGEN